MATAFISIAACSTSAPLNPNYKVKEYDFYLSDLNAKGIVLPANLKSPAREAAKAHNIPVLELSTGTDTEAGLFTLSCEGISIPSITTGFAKADDAALILHTSGTTSRPKMVPLTQRNITTSAASIVATLNLQPEDCCLNVMPLFHIHGLIGTLLSSLTAGASIFCSPGFDSEKFYTWVEQQRPTWYSAVPTIHQAVLAEAKNHLQEIARASFRFIRSSSASLPPQVMAELEGLFNVPVIEAYGMTEASHQMTSNPLPPQERKPGSVGVMAGPEVAIMDETGTLLNSGEPGEIVIQGESVFQGYANNPQANEDSFCSGWFRTGDQGMIDADGYLFITGRLKEIINKGGEKISPREIDEVLLGHPDIIQAVAFSVPHPTLGEEVGAAVVLRQDAMLTQKQIRDHVADKLTEFKVPNHVVFVDEIPKGATGKLQRIGLVEKLSHLLNPEYIAPRTFNEKHLAEIFIQVLGVEKVGINDNYFSLGGDSLRATQIISRICMFFHVEFPFKAFFEAPTIAELAVEILKRQIPSHDPGFMERMRNKLTNLSEEEAQKRLLT